MNYIGLQTFAFREIQRFLRTFMQTVVSPWISASLYIIVFGVIVGKRISLIGGVEYVDFVLPGIVMLNIINSAFSQTAFSLYFQRFARHIEEALTAPLSYLEMIIGYVSGGVARSAVVGAGVYVLAIFFSSASILHFGAFIFYAVSVSIIFSLLGLLVGLWSDSFEQLSILNTFLITPLTFLGGVFNSVSMLPEKAQMFVRLNPFFYFVDGFRYSMIGVSESNIGIGVIIIVGLVLVLGGTVWYLFKIGWRIRN
ncbi:MAG: ABC transporter permease [bacterium]|nr:ABC transporter permease [bacterium]